MTTTNGHESSGLASFVRPYLVRHRRALGVSSGLTVSTIVVDLARPWPLAIAVDQVLSARSGGDGADVRSLVLLALLAAAGAATGILSALLDARATLVAETTAEQVGADLRTDVFGRALDLGLPWHDRMRTGELVARLTSDVGRVMDGLVAATAVLVPETLALASLAVVLVVVDPVLALVALAVCPVLGMLGLRQRRQVRDAQGAAREASGRLAARTTDLLRNVPAIQAFGRQRRVAGRFATVSHAVRSSETEALRTQARWAPRPESVLALGSALVLLIGGWQVVQGRHSVGELLVVLAYSRDLYTPVRSLTRLSGSLAKAGVSADRLSEVLAADGVVTDRPGATNLADRVHTVCFEQVGLAYGERRALSGFDLSVRAGETVALVGPSGAGKSSALGLVLRLREPQAGRVTIDGRDVRDLRLASLREHVAYVPQDAWLFDGTLLENISFGSASPCRADAVRAGRRADLESVVSQLPDGWDTPLGEGGTRLSGGQRRRVALARAIVSGAPVILLDEPTASLDEATAEKVVSTLRDLARHRTLLIATHDPALMDLADRVVDVRAASLATGGPEIPEPTRIRKEVNPDDHQPHRPTRHPAPRQDPHPVPHAQPLARLTPSPTNQPDDPARRPGPTTSGGGEPR